MTKKNAEMTEEARFEKGKPADPTENMSPEDAEKWEEMTEKHKDKFKEGSLRANLIKLAYDKPELRDDILPLVREVKTAAKTPDAYDVADMQTAYVTRYPYAERLKEEFTRLGRYDKAIGALYEREISKILSVYEMGSEMAINLANDYNGMLARVRREMGQLEKAKKVVNDDLKEAISGLKDDLEDYEDMLKDNMDDRAMLNTRHVLANVISILEEMDF